MREIDELRERHKQELEKFVEDCPHPSIGPWIPYMWAPGHAHSEVRTCERCDCIMEERSLFHTSSTAGSPEWEYYKSENISNFGGRGRNADKKV